MNAFIDEPQIEETDLFDDMYEGYNISDDEWSSYYEAEYYDDNTWDDLGGVNIEF